MATQDLHYRPDVVDPSEYVWCGLADHAPHKGVDFILIRHDILARHGVETGSSNPRSSVNVPFHERTEDGQPNYRCHHCHKRGKGIRYFIFFLHKPTREVVIFGRDCAVRFRMATKAQLDIESMRDEWLRVDAQRRWATDHSEEVNYLREYYEQAKQGGKYNEFFDSLYDNLQRYGLLTDGQVSGLRRWMAKGKPWETKPHQITPEEADAKQNRVTRANEEPTSEQVTYALRLWKELDKTGPRPYVKGMTRKEAEDLINQLKAERANGPANSRQLTLINFLMEERSMPPENRQEARRQFDAGLTYNQASRWIDKLQELPKA